MTNEEGKKEVSFAYSLVTASWSPINNNNNEGNQNQNKLFNSFDEKHQSVSKLNYHKTHSVHQIVDSLSLELQLPLVAKYRVVEFIWQQCFHFAIQHDIHLPPRPHNVFFSIKDDNYMNYCKQNNNNNNNKIINNNMFGNSDISSASLRVMDGISLQMLAELPITALQLHPYSHQLNPVTKPILNFITNTCTLQLSRRQNNIVGLLPKVMEIIIFLCYLLERGTLLREEAKDIIHSHHTKHNNNNNNSSSREPSLSLSRPLNTLYEKSYNININNKSINLIHKCAWWWSRLQNNRNPRPHRLFADVKKLLQQPGPMCEVKSGYLQYIVYHFFPNFNFISQTPKPIVPKLLEVTIGNNNNTINVESDENLNEKNNIKIRKEPVDDTDTSINTKNKKWWKFQNG